ncbi:MAG: hypothetical protein JJU01_03730 [Alkalibacterium sp.]|nr:hypothetical protein [Alkalibacterium sp.]TVP92766.1 MAG: hypothetical protein EA249_01720 [Alkalibacterium sp.]
MNWRDEAGVTFIESIMVLSIVSFIIGLPAVQLNHIRKQSETQLFFDSLSASITLIQNYAVLNNEWTSMEYRPSRGTIHFRVVGNSSHPINHVLTVPEHMKILSTANEIRYVRRSGTISNPHTLAFQTINGKVECVFQIGSGRFDIR